MITTFLYLAYLLGEWRLGPPCEALGAEVGCTKGLPQAVLSH